MTAFEMGGTMGDDEERMSAAEVLRRYRSGRRDFRNLEIDDDERDGPVLRGAVLEGADFSESFIVADFSGARLVGVSFRDSNVKTCNFDRADLTDADFRRAAIDAATFEGAVFDGADFEGAIVQGGRFRKGERPA